MDCLALSAKRRGKLWIVTCWMAMLAAFSAHAHPEVVILNSYHYGEAWTDNELAGIIPALQASYPNLVPTVEYLDSKRFPSPQHIERVKEFLVAKYRARRVDLVILLDNPALDMIRNCKHELFAGVPKVFAGINGFQPQHLAGLEKITGVSEYQDMTGTLRLARRLHPQATQVLAIHDYTASGLAVRQEMETAAQMFTGKLRIDYAADCGFDGLNKQLRTLPGNTIVLILTYVTDKDGHTFTREESTRLICSASKAPVYAMHETRLGFGIVGGQLLEGLEHGRQAARLALRVLNGEDAGTIPVQQSHSRTILDYQALQRFEVTEGVWPDNAVVINRPASLWSRHRNVLLPACIIICVLSLALICLAVAIARQRHAEEVLRQFKMIIDSANFGVAMVDLQGHVTYVNESFAGAHGLSVTETIGRHLSIFHCPEQMEQVNCLIGQMQAGTSFNAQEVRHCRQDGSSFPMLMTGKLVCDTRGVTRSLAATAVDISEHKKMEDQLRQAQKMESVGRLAGGVAHDFNNMLGVIIGRAEMALLQARADQTLHEHLQDILNAARRSADLTRQLLAFARKQTIEPRVLDLNEVVAGMLKMLRRLIGEDISLAWRPGSQVWPVRMDPAQLDQILANLCVNARDAISGAGQISIETGNAHCDEIYCASHPGFVPGDYVMLAVSDSGCGMSKEVLAHLFEPFFTTKEMGHGTGLGLATVYGIVKQNSGFIHVYSEPGHGTIFRIYLPALAGKNVEAAPAATPGPPKASGQMVLLVEDEPAVLKMGKLLLEKLGYRVLAASTPSQAIQLAKEHANEIELLLTDVVMPEMNGRELAGKIAACKPDLRCLFMSGYSADVIAHHGVVEEGMHFLHKPFSMNALALKVQEVLG